MLPSGKRLIEPFAGSAAIAVNTRYSHYLLADNNSALINLYQQLQLYGAEFIGYCKQFFKQENNNPESYYALREQFNHTTDMQYKAALFVYLNRYGYNGLCRFNSKGKFNVPFGRYIELFFPSEAMMNFYKKFKDARFEDADFLKTMRSAKKGDVIYCDPPYVPLSKTANFTAYSAYSFNEVEQLRLAKEAERLGEKGITVVISNHDTPFTREMYKKAKLKYFKVRRSISQDGNNRHEVDELLAIYNYPDPT